MASVEPKGRRGFESAPGSRLDARRRAVCAHRGSIEITSTKPAFSGDEGNYSQAGDAPEFVDIIGQDRMTMAAGSRGDDQVMGADQLAFFSQGPSKSPREHEQPAM